MRIRYRDWQETMGELGRQARFRLLLRLFNYFLIRHDGDVDEALEQLEHYGTRLGYLDETFTIDDFKEMLREGRYIVVTPGGHRLTPKGERAVRTDALRQIFGSLRQGTAGDHKTPHTGSDGERLPETRPYRFGDPPTEIDALRTIHNAVRRDARGEIHLEEDDFEVYEHELLTSVATVLLIDISHSMILYGEDRITPAKRVALALVELIRSRYPKDHLNVVVFGDTAWEIPPAQLPYVGVGPYHTNTRDALALARRLLLRKKHQNRQIFMITDGKPSALTEGRRLYVNSWGLDRRIVAKTLDEAAECRRHGIPITSFMLARDPLLVRFIERLTEVNRGRAYYASPDEIDRFVFVDYIRNRRRRW